MSRKLSPDWTESIISGGEAHFSLPGTDRGGPDLPAPKGRRHMVNIAMDADINA